jgi:antitoxin ParD1/3/4
MRTTLALSITLPIPMAEMVKSKVASGEYASESEVIRDGLRMLSARDAAVEKWLLEEVAPAYDEAKAHPERLLEADKVRANLTAHMKARSAGKQS